MWRGSWNSWEEAEIPDPTSFYARFRSMSREQTALPDGLDRGQSEEPAGKHHPGPGRQAVPGGPQGWADSHHCRNRQALALRDLPGRSLAAKPVDWTCIEIPPRRRRQRDRREGRP